MVFLFRLLVEIRYQNLNDDSKVEYKVAAALLTKEIQNTLIEEQISSIETCDETNSCILIHFVSDNTLQISVTNDSQVLNIIKKDVNENILSEDVRQIPEKDETGYLGRYANFGYNTSYFTPVNSSYDYKYNSLMKISISMYDSLDNEYPIVVYYPYTGGTNFSSFSYHILTVITDGGLWNGTSPQTISSGNTVTINNPTKSGYSFAGWSVTGTGSSMDGTTFTMGTDDATLTANWIVGDYTLTVNANGGTWSGTTPQTIAYGYSVTIVNPTKSGYVFTGWTVSGDDSSMDGTTFTMGTENAVITANWLAFSSMYTYTGTSSIINDGNSNWQIRFLTSGTFTPNIDMSIDAFLVGGGGGGGSTSSSTPRGGGGGGYTATYTSISLTSGSSYSIVIGAGGAAATNGSASTAFGHSAAGGYGTSHLAGANGGSGGGSGSGYDTAQYAGYGGTNGGNGGTAGDVGGTGQGTTTKAFGGTTGDPYAGGGSGGVNQWGDADWARAGGILGGGTGGISYHNGTNGAANTGGGGGGAGGGYEISGGSGGSGIVIIRNHR